MRRGISGAGLIVVVLVAAGLMRPAGVALAKDPPYKPITQEIMQLVLGSPEIGTLLKRSIEEAKRSNPDRTINPVQSLTDYYDFVDTASELIPRQVLNHPASLTRDQVLQSICYF
jgi:phosphatidylserine decarboxylase